MKINSQGFTLIELLLYMLIFPTLLLVLSSLFASIMTARLEAGSYTSVDKDGRYIMAKLIYDFQSADSAVPATNYIETPVANASGSLLKIWINSISNTYSLSANGDLELNNNLGINKLNSSDSTVSNLTFQRIGAGTNRDTVRVSFRLTSKISRQNGPEFRDFQTTLSMP